LITQFSQCTYLLTGDEPRGHPLKLQLPTKLQHFYKALMFMTLN